jgi:hypothetical protein
VGGHRADLVVRWAERLCGSPFAKMVAVLDQLDVPLDPPPLGAHAVDLDERFEPRVELGFRAGTITRPMLEARLGEPNELVRLHPDSPYTFAWEVGVVRSPFDVTVMADFPWDGTETTGAARISWRVHEPRRVAFGPPRIVATAGTPAVPVAHGADAKACPRCRWPNPPDIAFCGSCGAFLDW